jgi:hypothetical protein
LPDEIRRLFGGYLHSTRQLYHPQLSALAWVLPDKERDCLTVRSGEDDPPALAAAFPCDKAKPSAKSLGEIYREKANEYLKARAISWKCKAIDEAFGTTQTGDKNTDDDKANKVWKAVLGILEKWGEKNTDDDKANKGGITDQSGQTAQTTVPARADEGRGTSSPPEKSSQEKASPTPEEQKRQKRAARKQARGGTSDRSGQTAQTTAPAHADEGRETSSPPGKSSQEKASLTSEEQKKAADDKELFVASYVALYLGPHFAHLRMLAHAMIWPSLLLLLAAASYPLQPERPLLNALVGLLAAVAAATVYVLYKINRDGLVSRITRTAPDRFTPDSGFFSSVLTYVAPVATVALLQFLGLFRFIVEPILGLFQ